MAELKSQLKMTYVKNLEYLGDLVLTFHIGSCYNRPTILLEARLRLVGQPFCQHLTELGVKESGLIMADIKKLSKTKIVILS